ncbi:MAG: hypothetical protein Q9218_007121 [Villophora microphyllina]
MLSRLSYEETQTQFEISQAYWSDRELYADQGEVYTESSPLSQSSDSKELTLRLSDITYDNQSKPMAANNALVLYNAALVAAPPLANPVLPVAGQQLGPWVHSPQGIAVLALPGRDVPFVRGAITGQQVLTHRPSYINAILIQSRGHQLHTACDACRGGAGLRPFPECRRTPGHFGGCCGNCKWRDHCARCSVRETDSPDGGSVVESLSSDDDNNGLAGGPPASLPASLARRVLPASLAPGFSRINPVVLV